jgi:hypothetical protein
MVGGLVDQALINLLASLAPHLVDLAKKVGLDLKRARKDDLLIILHAYNHQEVMKVLDNQTRILNDIHGLLVKVTEDTAVLLRRTEQR